MKVRVKIGEDVGDLKAQVDAPSTKEKVRLLEAHKEFYAELAKNWIVFLGGTILAVFFLGAGIIGVFDGTFDELAKVSNAALPFAGLLFGYAVGKTVSGGSDNGKDDE